MPVFPFKVPLYAKKHKNKAGFQDLTGGMIKLCRHLFMRLRAPTGEKDCLSCRC